MTRAGRRETNPTTAWRMAALADSGADRAQFLDHLRGRGGIGHERRQENSGGARMSLIQSAQISIDGAEEHFPVDGLGEIVGAAGVETFGAIAAHGVGGQGDDGKFVSKPAELSGGRVAVDFGHLHVHQDEIERLGLDAFDGFAAVGRDDNLGAGHGEVHRQQVLIVDPILGEEDSPAKDGFIGRSRLGVDRAASIR